MSIAEILFRRHPSTSSMDAQSRDRLKSAMTDKNVSVEDLSRLLGVAKLFARSVREGTSSLKYGRTIAAYLAISPPIPVERAPLWKRIVAWLAIALTVPLSGIVIAVGVYVSSPGEQATARQKRFWLAAPVAFSCFSALLFAGFIVKTRHDVAASADGLNMDDVMALAIFELKNITAIAFSAACAAVFATSKRWRTTVVAALAAVSISAATIATNRQFANGLDRIAAEIETHMATLGTESAEIKKLKGDDRLEAQRLQFNEVTTYLNYPLTRRNASLADYKKFDVISAACEKSHDLTVCDGLRPYGAVVARPAYLPLGRIILYGLGVEPIQKARRSS